MPFFRHCLGLMSVAVLMSLIGCTESSSTDSLANEGAGFVGTISGAVDEKFSGPGLVTFIAPQKTVSGIRQGYYLVSNGIPEVMENKWVVTFRIPEGTNAGNYHLVSAEPQNVGEEFEARLEGKAGSRSLSFHLNTKGNIFLDAFPKHGNQSSETPIKGKFRFSAENSQGEVVVVNGTFDFPVEERKTLI